MFKTFETYRHSLRPVDPQTMADNIERTEQELHQIEEILYHENFEIKECQELNHKMFRIILFNDYELEAIKTTFKSMPWKYVLTGPEFSGLNKRQFYRRTAIIKNIIAMMGEQNARTNFLHP